MLRAAFGISALWLLVGCSLLAPSRDEISGDYQKGDSGGSANGGSSGASLGGGGGGVAGGGGSGGGAAGAGGSAGASGSGGTGGAQLLFDDEFDDEKPEWQFGGDGSWAVQAGEANQTSPLATEPVRWVASLTALTDYRIEVRARRTNKSDGALQILFRVTGVSAFYYCSFHPGSGEMYWGIYYGNFDSAELGTAPLVPVNYDPDQTFTMTVTAKGSLFNCSVLEVPAATASLVDSTRPTGGPGLKTYQLTAAYDYIRVYSE